MELSRTALQARLDLALEGARKAGEIILGYYQGSVEIVRKKDNSPVTIADRSAEEFLRGQIAKHFPEDGILGEEFGEQPGTSGYRWILDPLDGTKSFIHGGPLFGTLIGVEYQGRCVVGVCHFPVLNETAWGATGLGAWWRPSHAMPRTARVSTVADPREALFCFTTVAGFERIGRPEVFQQLVQTCGLSRGWGDCYGHILVATGRAEIMVDPLMNPWDIAALIPIVEEAGGHCVDWNGSPNVSTGNGISVTPAFRELVLGLARQH